MTEQALREYIQRNFPKENEKCEWKEFKSLKNNIAGRDGDDAISYISAISNMYGGHLVLGVKDTTLEIVGIQDFADYTIDNVRFRVLGNCVNLNSEGFYVEEFRTTDSNKIVWVFHIPSHPFRLPVYAHKKAWQRIDDNLVELTSFRLNNILNQPHPSEDWSAVTLLDATLQDLDPNALVKARHEFAKRNPKYKEEIPAWDDAKFLAKAKLTIQGKITRAAMILLGREESEYLLNSRVKIRWNLKAANGNDRDYEVFSIPFILAIEEIQKKVRNLKYRYVRYDVLFPEEVLRYEPFNIREPINNAIAHQDYSQGARINVVEFEDDRLVFSNYGTFIPKSVEEVVLRDTPEELYRNPFLVEAMKNLDMIETQGGGIRKLFQYQRDRLFPMPEYDLSDGKVKVTIIGRVLDEEFARILIYNPSLSLEDLLLLDKVQKQKELTEQESKYLKKRKLIEGRKPNFYLSKHAIISIDNDELKAEYIRNRNMDDEYLKTLILNYLGEWGSLQRHKIESFLIPKISDALNVEQKHNKVMNLIQELRKAGLIESRAGKTWHKI